MDEGSKSGHRFNVGFGRAVELDVVEYSDLLSYPSGEGEWTGGGVGGLVGAAEGELDGERCSSRRTEMMDSRVHDADFVGSQRKDLLYLYT